MCDCKKTRRVVGYCREQSFKEAKPLLELGYQPWGPPCPGPGGIAIQAWVLYEDTPQSPSDARTVDRALVEGYRAKHKQNLDECGANEDWLVVEVLNAILRGEKCDG